MAIVVAVCTAVVLAPVGVLAATGPLVNIADPTTGSLARVDGGNARIGDGSCNLTVDGAVLARDMDANFLVYKSPPRGLSCSGDSSGMSVGTFNLSRYSRLRLAVRSPDSQTIVDLRAKAGTEVIPVEHDTTTIGVGGTAHKIIEAPAPSTEIRVYCCINTQIFIYGLR